MATCPLCFCPVLTVWLLTSTLDSSTSRLTWDDLVDSKGSLFPSKSHAGYQSPAPNPVTIVLYQLAHLLSSWFHCYFVIFILFIIVCCILASYISYQVVWLIFKKTLTFLFFFFHLSPNYIRKVFFWYNLKETFAILMEIWNSWK